MKFTRSLITATSLLALAGCTSMHNGSNKLYIPPIEPLRMEDYRHERVKEEKPKTPERPSREKQKPIYVYPDQQLLLC